MPVRIGERTYLAPRRVGGLSDDLGAGLVGALNQLVDGGVGRRAEARYALAVSAACDLVVSDDPAEARRWEPA